MLLDAAGRIDDLRVPPGNRLKLLEPKSAGTWQIRIDAVHRIRFRWDGANAQDVQIGNFHDDD
jgi:proteic killer suppression protein